MNFTLDIDDRGHLVCHLSADDVEVMAGAADAPAAGDALVGAAEDAFGSDGYGECEWLVPGGEYRWMLRREGPVLTVAVMWSSGTCTGYQHVFRSECDAAWFLERVRVEVARASMQAL